ALIVRGVEGRKKSSFTKLLVVLVLIVTDDVNLNRLLHRPVLVENLGGVGSSHSTALHEPHKAELEVGGDLLSPTAVPALTGQDTTPNGHGVSLHLSTAVDLL